MRRRDVAYAGKRKLRRDARTQETQETQETQPHEERRGDQRCLVIMGSDLYTVFYPSTTHSLPPHPPLSLPSLFLQHNSKPWYKRRVWTRRGEGSKNDTEQRRGEEVALIFQGLTFFISFYYLIYVDLYSFYFSH